MKKEHKTRILVAAANELKKGARDNYRLTDLPVPKINSKDFNQTYVSPLGYFSLSLESGKIYWELSVFDRDDAVRRADIILNLFSRKSSIHHLLKVENVSREECNGVANNLRYHRTLEESVSSVGDDGEDCVGLSEEIVIQRAMGYRGVKGTER